MSEIPLAYSDIQCGECFEYFRLDGDLIDHRAQVHGSSDPEPCTHGSYYDTHDGMRHCLTCDHVQTKPSDPS